MVSAGGTGFSSQVPAVALGILEKGLSWKEVLMIQRTV
jgi:hypothetical protein